MPSLPHCAKRTSAVLMHPAPAPLLDQTAAGQQVARRTGRAYRKQAKLIMASLHDWRLLNALSRTAGTWVALRQVSTELQHRLG
jgi:hypothetical protein